jgi:TolB-like protein
MYTRHHHHGLSLWGLTLLVCLFSSSVYAQAGRSLKQAQNAAKARQWDVAVHQSTNSLYQKSAKNWKAQDVLELAFPRFVSDYEERIARLQASSATFRDERTVRERREIINLYETLIRYSNDVAKLPPAALQAKNRTLRFEFKDYYEELASAQSKLESGVEDAAEAHYREGIRLAAMGGIKNSRDAARQFKSAMSYVANYKDAAQRYETARKAGTTRVAVIPFENLSGQNQYGAVGIMITDKIVSSLFRDQRAMEFMEIVDRDQLELVMREQKLAISGAVDDNSLVAVGKILGVTEIITGRITQIVSDRDRVTSENIPVKRNIQVQVGTQKNAEGKDVPVMGDREVNATVTSFMKTASARMSGSYKIIDVETSKLIETQTFTETYQFNHQWGTFRGDERALDNQMRRLVNVSEANPLSDGERVNELGTKLANNLANTIRNYALRF